MCRDAYRQMQFQPTRPLRGATVCVNSSGFVGMISTHAPLAGRDSMAAVISDSCDVFQPTRPLRGAT